MLADLEALAVFVVERGGAENRPHSPALSAAGFAPGDLERVAKLTSDDWLGLSLVEISSEPVFEHLPNAATINTECACPSPPDPADGTPARSQQGSML